MISVYDQEPRHFLTVTIRAAATLDSIVMLTNLTARKSPLSFRIASIRSLGTGIRCSLFGSHSHLRKSGWCAVKALMRYQSSPSGRFRETDARQIRAMTVIPNQKLQTNETAQA